MIEKLAHVDPELTSIEGLHAFESVQDQKRHSLGIICNQSSVCIMLEYYSTCI